MRTGTNVPATAITGTGLFTPPYSISNDELVASFNVFAARYNSAHSTAIAAGTVTPLTESSVEFIAKASGIKNRYVMDKAGILDPEIMCPRLPQRPTEQGSIMAEMAIASPPDRLRS